MVTGKQQNETGWVVRDREGNIIHEGESGKMMKLARKHRGTWFACRS